MLMQTLTQMFDKNCINLSNSGLFAFSEWHIGNESLRVDNVFAVHNIVLTSIILEVVKDNATLLCCVLNDRG